MKLYGAPHSRSTRVAWTLEEVGLPWVYVRVNLRAGAHRSPAFRTLNPAAKVPVLQDGDLVLAESGAICRHIAAKSTHRDLLPPEGTAARAHVERWMDFVLTELEQPLWTMAKHTFVLPETLRIPDIVPVAEKEFRRAAETLAAGLQERTHLVGDAFTLADLFAAHTLGWARSIGQPLPSDTLADYAEHHLRRPALERAEEREEE